MGCRKMLARMRGPKSNGAYRSICVGGVAVRPGMCRPKLGGACSPA